MDHQEIRITRDEMLRVIHQLFLGIDFPEEKAKLLAETFTETTLSGVNSHGVNRVPKFISYIKEGLIDIFAEAEKIETFGSIERWDGQSGPGIINAVKCTDRAIKLAKKNGLGLVALRNTNHWMRGGTYGHQAANAGCIAILFTNTIANMPAWGGKVSRIGNNPFIVAVPRAEGHIVLDMAISQFSFGKIDNYRLKGEALPHYGGWDEEGNLSKDPKQILQSEKGLPIGYWKGSALSMVLDMLVTILSAGNSTFRISQKGKEADVSQFFLCIYPQIFGDVTLQEKLLQEIIDYVHAAESVRPEERTYFPGERSAQTRKDRLKNGIPVSKEVWKIILQLSK